MIKICKERAVRGIEQIPWLYDAVNRLAEMAGLDAWRRWLAGDARGRILELGAGTGRNLPLYPEGSRVVALEPDRGVLAAARRRAPGFSFVLGRAEHLPFRANAFETVVSGFVFCSVDDPARGLREVGRVLAPQGELRMMEHVRATGRLHARLQDTVQPMWTWMTGGCRPNRDTEQAVRDAGFVIDDTTRHADRTLRRFVAKKRVG